MATLSASSRRLILRTLSGDLYFPEKAAGIQLRNNPNAD